VVIPTFLEAESIAAVVAALPRDIVDRVVVVDGGSPDGTAEVACRAGAEVITVGRGYGRACQTGAQAADAARRSRNSPMSQTTMPPILSHKHYSARSTFTPESLLREARRQKGLPSAGRRPNTARPIRTLPK